MSPTLGPSQVFLPWVGSKYASHGLDGVRILALGESHYGVEVDKHPGFTQHVVRRWGLEERSRYFTITAKYALGMTSGDYLRMEDRRRFWDSVAFYNYVQDIPGKGPGERPTETMWRASAEPFRHVLRELKPDVLLVLGKELWRWIPKVGVNGGSVKHGAVTAFQLPSGKRVWTCSTNHPSRSPSYSRWQPVVQETIDRAKASDGA